MSCRPSETNPLSTEILSFFRTLLTHIVVICIVFAKRFLGLRRLAMETDKRLAAIAQGVMILLRLRSIDASGPRNLESVGVGTPLVACKQRNQVKLGLQDSPPSKSERHEQNRLSVLAKTGCKRTRILGG